MGLWIHTYRPIVKAWLSSFFKIQYTGSGLAYMHTHYKTIKSAKQKNQFKCGFYLNKRVNGADLLTSVWKFWLEDEIDVCRIKKVRLV